MNLIPKCRYDLRNGEGSVENLECDVDWYLFVLDLPNRKRSSQPEEMKNAEKK